MSRRAIAALQLLLVVVGVCVISNLTYRKRQQERAILDDKVAEYLERGGDFDRRVDIGVELCTVVQDDAGDELVPGAPRLRIIDRHKFGGIVDTRERCIVGPSRAPRTGYCSEDQAAVILHGIDGALEHAGDALGQLVYGSEGAGKTTVTAMWHYIRWVEHLGEGRIGGQTAPTKRRLRMVRREIFRLFPRAWYTHRKAEDIFTFCDGTQLELVSTHKKSDEEGSPIQGQNWSWCAREECQDQIDAHEDIESRGRSARDGRYPQLATATAKDNTRWRTFRDRLTASGLWFRRTLLGRRSPFIAASFWDAKLRTMSPREYQRRVEAQDVPPELAAYYCWDRSRNLVAGPRIGADVTVAVLANYRPYTRPGRFVLLGGHDPGVIFNTTTIKRLVMFGKVPTWVVVGEFQTKQTTAREHALRLRLWLREKFGVETLDPDSGKVLFFIDPHGKGETETDYETVYRAFQAAGLDAFNPSPKVPGQTTGRIKRSVRVEMMNRLMSDAAGTVRFVISCDEARRAVRSQAGRGVRDAREEAGRRRPGGHAPQGRGRQDPRARGRGLCALSIREGVRHRRHHQGRDRRGREGQGLMAPLIDLYGVTNEDLLRWVRTEFAIGGTDAKITNPHKKRREETALRVRLYRDDYKADFETLIDGIYLDLMYKLEAQEARARGDPSRTSPVGSSTRSRRSTTSPRCARSRCATRSSTSKRSA